MAGCIDWVKILYRPLARQAARQTIIGRVRDQRSPERGRFTAPEIEELLAIAWRAYDQASPGLADQPTTGSSMNLRLACFTLCVFNALLEKGAERAYAIELVADATWSVYRQWARLAATAARFAPARRSALAFASIGNRSGAISLRFPFNAPGYLVEPVEAASGVAFDVVRCPVASYFREHDAVDLCLASWCNLDYALADMSRQLLARTKTLVETGERCDFRVLPQRRSTR
jgi:ubiquinone biosynthesis protein